jgi:hypothetical protein
MSSQFKDEYGNGDMINVEKVKYLRSGEEIALLT